MSELQCYHNQNVCGRHTAMWALCVVAAKRQEAALSASQALVQRLWVALEQIRDFKSTESMKVEGIVTILELQAIARAALSGEALSQADPGEQSPAKEG